MGTTTPKKCKFKNCKETYYSIEKTDNGFCDWHNSCDQTNRKGY